MALISRRRSHAAASVDPFLGDVESLLRIGLPAPQAFGLALKSHEPLQKVLGDEEVQDASLAVLLASAASRGKLPQLAAVASEVACGLAAGLSAPETLRQARASA